MASNATSEQITIYYKAPDGTRVHLDTEIPCGDGEIAFKTSPGARHIFAAGIPLNPSHIQAIDHAHIIIRDGTIRKHQITLRNNTEMNIEVSAAFHSVEEERSVKVYTLAPDVIYVLDMEEGTKLTATAADGVTAVHPVLKRVNGPETFVYTCDLHIPDIERDAIRRWLPNKIFTLIYKAQRDGFDITHFAKICHHSGPSIAIITSMNGYRFGGYAPDGWDHATNGWNNNRSTFSFSLCNPRDAPPTQYSALNLHGTCGYYMGTSRHLTFGANDIFLDLSGTQGHFRSASDPTSLLGFPGAIAFTGNAHFDVQEIEVYQVRDFRNVKFATYPTI